MTLILFFNQLRKHSSVSLSGVKRGICGRLSKSVLYMYIYFLSLWPLPVGNAVIVICISILGAMQMRKDGGFHEREEEEEKRPVLGVM